MSRHTSLVVYDVTGNVVAALVSKKQSAGNYSVTFDGSNYTSGIYFYKLEIDGFSETKKMILLR